MQKFIPKYILGIGCGGQLSGGEKNGGKLPIYPQYPQCGIVGGQLKGGQLSGGEKNGS